MNLHIRGLSRRGTVVGFVSSAPLPAYSGRATAMGPTHIRERLPGYSVLLLLSPTSEKQIEICVTLKVVTEVPPPPILLLSFQPMRDDFNLGQANLVGERMNGGSRPLNAPISSPRITETFCQTSILRAQS